MRKRILGTIIAAGFFAVAAFAGANGLAETQAACEHSQVKDRGRGCKWNSKGHLF